DGHRRIVWWERIPGNEGGGPGTREDIPGASDRSAPAIVGLRRHARCGSEPELARTRTAAVRGPTRLPDRPHYAAGRPVHHQTRPNRRRLRAARGQADVPAARAPPRPRSSARSSSAPTQSMYVRLDPLEAVGFEIHLGDQDCWALGETATTDRRVKTAR